MRRFLFLYPLPALLLLVAVALPLIRGTETLYHRDVLHAHFGVKTAQAEAWRAGYVPEIDVYRAGGQPLAGNPNSVPFYPDNLLYLVAPVLWALNAHFWLHLLLAPCAAFWMGRAWGLSREGAWAVGVSYGVSGFFLSHLAFYNLIAGAALAPALVAACLRAQERARESSPGDPRARRMLVAAGAIWGLLVLSGDPFLALLAFGLAATAVGIRAGTLRPVELARRVPLLPLALAFVGGTLLAAPQWAELLRILPLSFRGHFGYGGGAGVIESFDPRQALEWVLPLAFGRPDRLELGRFWGWEFYTGFPPYYYSLYPGLLAVALWLFAGRPRERSTVWAWAVMVVGVFFALGGFNPAASWIFELGLLRYPVKFWLLVALGASLLCGKGFERAFGSEPGESTPEAREGEEDPGETPRRSFGVVLAALALFYMLVFAVLQLARGPSTAFLRALIPERYPDAFVLNEYLRWSGLALFSCLLLALFGLALWGLRRRPRVAGAVLLGLHVASQLFFLAPLRDTDAALPYRTPPPTLAYLPQDARVVHGNFMSLFGPDAFVASPLPGPESHWYVRRTFFELYPTTGAQWGRRYQLNVSPEGLDAFVAEIARSAVEQAESDLERLRLLRAWGVDVLLLGRELEPEARPRVAESVETTGFGGRLGVHRLADPAPEVFFAGRVVPAGDINTAVERLESEDFDPLRSVVIPGDGEPTEGAGGTARFVTRGPESFEVEVDARSSGVLVVQRAHLDLWRVTVDGEEADPVAANLYRLGVSLPPGHHRVRFWIDRRPLAGSALLALLGAGGLIAGLAWRPRRRAASG